MTFPIPGMEGLADGFTHGARQAREWADLRLDHLSNLLDDIHDAVNNLDTHEEKVHRRATVQADATGLVIADLGAPREGFIWLIERVVTIVDGGAGSGAVLYVGGAAGGPSVAQGDAELAIDDADFYTGELGQPIHVPSGNPVRLRVEGAPANAQVNVRLQVTRLKAKLHDAQG